MQVPIPENETQRLAALRDCRLLDAAPEPAFDDLAKLAAAVCAAPIALVSFVDVDRQWAKSVVGPLPRQVPRDQCFCAHTILGPGLLVVPDARQDARFAGHPMVVGEPGVRFYAGAPLVTPEGLSVGALCVMDTALRQLTGAQAEGLEALARRVVAEIEHRRAEEHRRETESRFELFMQNLPGVAFMKDLENRRIYLNEECAKLHGLTVEQCLGKTDHELMPEAFAEQMVQQDRQIIESGKPVNLISTLPVGEGFRFFLVNKFPVAGKDARVVGTGGLAVDITERLEAEERLRQAENEYRELFETAPSGYHELDRDGRIVRVNQTECDLLGYPRERIIGRRLDEFLAPGEPPMPRVPEGGSDKPFERRLVRGDGSAIDVLILDRPLRDAEGRVAGVRCSVQDITERKATEAALRDSEAVYHSLVETLPQHILRKDLDGRFTFANGRFCQLIGRTPDQILGRTDHDLFPAPLADKYRADDLKVLRAQQTLDAVESHQLPNGEKRYVQVIKSPVHNAAGDLIGLQVVFWDVSERIAAEEKLKQVMAGARCLLWNAHVRRNEQGNFDWTFRVSNDEAARNFLALDVQPGDPYMDAWLRSKHPDDLPRMERTSVEALEAGLPGYSQEFRCHRADGQWRWLHEDVCIEKLSDGHWNLTGVCTDVTDRKQAEQALKKTEENYRSIFENAVHGIYQIAPDGRYLSANAALVRIFGYESFDELRGRVKDPFRQTYVDPERAVQVRDLMEHRGSVANLESQVYRKDGSIIWISETVRAARGADGGVLFYEGTVEDITLRKEAEASLQRYTVDLLEAHLTAEKQAVELAAKSEQLDQARKAAEAANRAKSEFLANMSHEIRTPMTAILGYADMMLEPGQSMSDRQDCLQVIRRNARHLLSLINDILDISKIEAGKFTVERIECDLPQLAADVLSMMRPRAVEKNLQFSASFEGAIPRQIQTDSLRLKQILVNLLGNAIKFTQAGEVRLKVSCNNAGPNALVRFDVTDTGIGLKQEQLLRLFQPFTQADESTTRKYGGTGLGLSISKRLAKLLGGDIVVQSSYGKGSTFSVWIDGGSLEGVELVSDVTEAVLPAPSKEKKESRQVVTLRGRILLAEDGKDNQRLISTHLRKAGAEVVIAEDGRVAVDLVRTQQFDLVLMDMQMPELDGYGATSELRRRGMTLPIVALTAHAMAEDRAKCMHAGCTDYLTKPIDKELLLQTVAQYLENPPAPPQPAVEPSTQKGEAVRSKYADDPDMKEIIGEFVSELPEQVAKLVNQLQASNLDELRRTVHQLKGAGGGYGFDRITQTAAAAEQQIKSAATLEQVVADVQALVDTIRQVEGYDPNREDRRAAEGTHH